jgi:uncharacterized RDD family membrane protein YckC
MQCAACRAVYSNGLEICPRCKRPASSASSPATASEKTVATDKKAAPRKASRATSGGAAASAAHASEAAATRAAAADGSATNAVADEPAPPASTASSAPSASTLIEFPGTARNRPQWRKDLSERVREIQARRAREAALESESASSVRAERANAPSGEATPHAASAEAQAAPQLGLVPPAETPEMNPIVAAALRRIERARQTPPPVTRSSGRGAAATAVARVVEEQYETQAETVAESASSARADSQAHASGLVVISAAPSVKAEATPDAATVAQDESPKISASVAQVEPAAQPPINPPSQTGKAILTSETAPSRTTEEKRAEDAPDAAARETKPLPRRVANPIIDDSTLTRLEAEILPPVVSAKDAFDDRAPLVSRFVAALLDLFVVAFLASPCAAVIELTSGNWSDPRVLATMSAIFILVMFLYQTGATALAGRTLGMKLLSLHTVDAETALSPTTRQSVRRALVYMLSLITFGLGLIYSLFDAEGRAAHDHLSGTVVVRE